jgi:glyoxylase-like metal-dependent hydrolase (beta-lactamase superfamily II)
MSSNVLSSGRVRALVLASALVGLSARAEAPSNSAAHAQPSPGDAAPLDAQLIKTGLYVISGGGANSLLRLTASGLILVDGKLPGNYRPLMSQVRKIARLGDLPVRALILTGAHEKHAGNSAQFLDAGVPIVAHENARLHLGSGGPELGKLAPTVTYGRDYVLRLGGVEAHLFHFGDAHTDGDTIVYFPNLKVVAVGDLYTREAPVPDYGAGGSFLGWSRALTELLKLSFDVVAASEGPPVTRADLESFAGKMSTFISRASELVRSGTGKDQLRAELRTARLGWQLKLSDAELTRFYAELTQANKLN